MWKLNKRDFETESQRERERRKKEWVFDWKSFSNKVHRFISTLVPNKNQKLLNETDISWLFL